MVLAVKQGMQTDFETVLDASHAWSWITGLYAEVELPTELVIIRTSVVRPRVARVYRTDLFTSGANFDDVRPFDDWRKIRRDFTYESGIQLLLAEIWEDQGDDGHVDFVFRGKYRWLSEQSLRSDLRAASGDGTCPYVYRRFVNHHLGDPSDGDGRTGYVGMDWGPR